MAESKVALSLVEQHALNGHKGAVLVVRLNRKGVYCLSGGKDKSIQLWNALKGAAVTSFTGHGYEVRDLAVQQDSSRFVSCGGDRQIFLWDVPGVRTIRKFKGHDALVETVALAAEDNIVISGGADQAVKIWDCRSNSQHALQSMKDFKDNVTSITVSTWPEILAASIDGSIIRYDIRRGGQVIDQTGLPVTCIALSNDQNCILATCLGGVILLLDKASGEILVEYRGHEHRHAMLESCFTPSDAFVCGASEDGSICMWEIVEAELVSRTPAHSGVVTSLAVHPRGTHMVSGGADGVVKVWASSKGL